MGLRYKVGGDTLTYMEWYVWARDLSNWSLIDPTITFEPGFTLLGALAKSIGDDFYYLQLLHAVILNSCIFILLYKNTKYRFSALLVALLTYYIYFSTEVLRESIAVMIFTLNFKSFLDKKWMKYYIGVFACIFFHLSASFLLFLPLCSKLKLNKFFGIVIIFFVAGCMALQPIFSILSDIAPVLGEKANNYSDHNFVGYLWAGIRVFQFSIIPYIFLFFSKKVFCISPKYEITYLFMILSGIGVVFSPIIFQRFTNYFYPLYALSITNVICYGITSFRLHKRIASYLLTLIILIGYGSYYIYLDAYKMWLPYSSILNPQEYSFRQKFANGGNG